MIKKTLLVITLILFQIVLLATSRFTVWPEMILYPWLLLNDYQLYTNIINPYFPLLPLTLAGVFQLLGVSVLSLKTITFFILSVTTVTVFISSFLITKQYFKSILAASLFIVLSYSFSGNGLWFELFLTPFAVLGITLIYCFPNHKKIILISGLLLAATFFIKQNAIFFAFPVIYLLFITNRHHKKVFLENLVIFFVPFWILGIFLMLYLIQKDILGAFFNWAVLLPLQLSSQNGFISLPAIRQYLFIFFPFLALIAVTKLKSGFFWIAVFIAAILFAFPRYEDFHLQTLIAFASLLAPILSKKYIGVFLLITLLLFGRSIEKNWQKPDRFLDPDMFELSQKIRTSESVYLLNAPELSYFFSQKLPPKIWGTTYPWYFENFDFENQFINNLTQENKQILVIGGNEGGEFGLGSYVPEKLMVYIKNNYEPVEVFQSYTIWQRK